tara:strand:+ start:66 stop:458 length:393 start_codon:yes stop_codon:yes gene_type:complete
MNHNGVISLPTDGASTYTAGMVVSVNNSGQAKLGTANSNMNGVDAIGVVLHDVKATETARPVDIQLFSAGGSALIQSSGTFTKGQLVEVIKNNTTGIVAGSVGVPTAASKTIGIALEGHTGAGLSRVALV